MAGQGAHVGQKQGLCATADNPRLLFTKNQTMAFALDSSAITHGIQLAVAPVFLLTAVSGMIGAVAGRLARIIDRARVVEDRACKDASFVAAAYRELAQLRTRGRLANGCIALLTFCSFLIGLTIICCFWGRPPAFRPTAWRWRGFWPGWCVSCWRWCAF